jgi:hypothetical protein
MGGEVVSRRAVFLTGQFSEPQFRFEAPVLARRRLYAAWNLGKTEQSMPLSHCPMCQSPVNAGETAKSCGSCGADLSRWTPKTQASPPMIQATGNGGEVVARETMDSHLANGVLGAAVGACIGSGLMYGFYAVTNFRFPLLATGIGFLTGLAARWLNKGGDDRLGFAAGALSLAGVVLTLFLMYGTFPYLSVLSAAISVGVAYRLASY